MQEQVFDWWEGGEKTLLCLQVGAKITCRNNFFYCWEGVSQRLFCLCHVKGRGAGKGYLFCYV